MSRTPHNGTVIVSNVSFVDVIATTHAPGAPRYSTATFRVEAGSDGIKNLKNAAGTDTNNLCVWKTARQIRFLFVDPAVRPLGISFRQLAVPNGASPDPDGRTNLPREKIELGTDAGRAYLSIHNKRDHCGRGNNPDLCKWEFKIVVEDASSGQIGIIHPEISNTDQEPAITGPKK